LSEIIGKYIQGGSGDWLTVKNAAVGSVVDVEQVWMDDGVFPNQPVDQPPKPSLCVGGLFNGGEECQVRISKTNARRIAETLGEEWVGHRIECVLHMDYPGVGARGLIWKGVKVEAKPEPEPSQKKLKKK